MRSSGLSPSRPTNAIREQTKETSVAPEAMTPAWKRLMRSSRSAIATTAPAGAKRQIHAAAITSPSERRELVHVEVDAVARHGHDQPQADDRLGGCDHHDGEREDLPVAVAGMARERDKREVSRVQHDLEREQDDQRAAADEDAEGARREEEDGDDEVRGDAGAGHYCLLSRGTALPRITPPTAATRRTMEVTSKASRCGPRKRRPISPGEPNPASTSAASARRPPALSAMTTTTSTAIAAAARTAATAWSVGPPAQGASARPPR